MGNDVDLIIHWEKVLEASSHYFSKKLGLEITHHDILNALFISLEEGRNYEWILDIYDESYTLQDVINILSEFEFQSLKNVIETDLDLVPRGLRMNYKVKIKSGLVWIIHRYDKDPFPSSPHAHNIENNFKLHLGNGVCYRKRLEVHRIQKKELIDIRKKILEKMDVELPVLEI